MPDSYEAWVRLGTVGAMAFSKIILLGTQPMMHGLVGFGDFTRHRRDSISLVYSEYISPQPCFEQNNQLQNEHFDECLRYW